MLYSISTTLRLVSANCDILLESSKDERSCTLSEEPGRVLRSVAGTVNRVSIPTHFVGDKLIGRSQLD